MHPRCRKKSAKTGFASVFTSNVRRPSCTRDLSKDEFVNPKSPSVKFRRAVKRVAVSITSAAALGSCSKLRKEFQVKASSVGAQERRILAQNGNVLNN